MSIIEVRLFELQCKGDHLDEVNAEEILTRRAIGHARRQALVDFTRRTCHQIKVWISKQQQTNRVKVQPTL